MFIFVLLIIVHSCSDQNCLQCTTSTICTACVILYQPQIQPYSVKDNSCIQSCGSNYYSNYVNNVKQCLPCNTNCLECYNGAPNGCTKCIKPKRLMCGNCIESTAESECSDCSSECMTCFGQTSSDCYLCLLPYFHSNNSCELTCQYPYYGDLNDYQCKDRCPSGTYGQPITRQCLNTCPDPYFKNELSTNCVRECPTGTYSYQQSCQLCNLTCETCSGGTPTDCIFCSQGYYMIDSQCSRCTNTQYSNEKMRTCVNYIEYSLNIIESYSSVVVFQISFSEAIDPSTFNISQITVANIDPNQYTLTLQSISDDQNFLVNTDFSISHKITNIVCNFTNSITNTDQTPVSSDIAVQKLQIPAQYIQPDGEAKSEEISTYLTIAFLSYFCFVFLLCLILRTQRRMFFLIINNLQCVQVMIFINFSFSTLTLNSLQILDIVNLKRIPSLGVSVNGIVLYFFNTPINSQMPNNNFLYNAGYYYNFISNGGVQILGILIIMWFIWLICYIMHNLYQINNKIETLKIIRSLHEGSNDLLVRVHELLFLPLMIICFLQLWGYDFTSDINIASFSLAIFTMLYYMLYFRSVYKSQFLDQDQQEMENKYFTFFSNFKQSNEIKKNFEFVNYFFKICNACALVILNNYPYIQYSISFTILTLYFGLLFYKRPYLRNIMNYSAILVNLVIMGLYIILIVAELQYQQNINSIQIDNSEVQYQYNCGLAFMILIQIILGFYAIIFSYNKLQDYLKFLEKKPEWGKQFLQKMEKIVFSDKVQEVEMGNVSFTS